MTKQYVATQSMSTGFGPLRPGDPIDDRVVPASTIKAWAAAGVIAEASEPDAPQAPQTPQDGGGDAGEGEAAPDGDNDDGEAPAAPTTRRFRTGSEDASTHKRFERATGPGQEQ